VSGLADLFRLGSAPYAAAATALAAYLLLGWLWSLARRDASVVDTLWGPGFLIVASVAAATAGGAFARTALILGLVGLWAIRLALHIGLRSLGCGEDYRYREMRERHGRRFPSVSLFTVFGLQGAILLFVAQPLVVAVVSPTPTRLGACDLAGTLVFLVGFFWEAVSDEQLRRFRADPANRGQVMDRGLWRFSRHPNYFGEALLWWGWWLVAAAVPSGWATFAGPLLMTFLLLRVSGVALLEKGLSRTKSGYADYVARTPAFVPWLPRRGAGELSR
jgi:steroid 5-alpha reductase family enzyme